MIALHNLLKSAINLQDVNQMLIYRLHELKGKRNGTYALDVDGKSCPLRMIIKPDDSSENEDVKSNLIDYYTSVTVIKIEEISNHYE